MASYMHGIISSEIATSVAKPTAIESAIGVIIGTAPVNRLKNPDAAVNNPILLSSYEEAVEKIGFSYDFKNYTLCQSVYIRFKKFFMAPIVVINVLDPKVHNTEVEAKSYNATNKKVEIIDQGILLDKIVVTSENGETTFTPEEDYMASFTEEGTVLLAIVPGGTIAGNSIKVAYTKIEPSKVTPTDIVGGFNTVTRKRTGADCVNMVYPLLSVVPCQLLAPGWSHIPVVAAMLMAKAKMMNQLFNAVAITDISTEDVKSIDELQEYKESKGYDDSFNIPCYPKAMVDGFEIYMSAIIDGVIAATDNATGGPYASPSNKSVYIDGTCMEGGEEVYFDMAEANQINGAGIMTALNMNGWRSWGNEMGCYPENKDVKDRFIVCRRVFNYQDNIFKLNFFDKVDKPTDYRLIESIVNAENLILSTLASAGLIAGGNMSFNKEDNPEEKILDGHITFKRTLSPFTPAKVIETVTEFDPTLNSAALGGE